jgi:hypothetical protein
MQTSLSRRKALGGLAALMIAGSTGVLSTPRPALAHEAPCPYCSMAITQDTATQDNETVLKIGRKRVEYKCVFCALADAQSEYKGDLTIAAPSETKDSPIVIKRVADKWTTAPGAVFVAQKGSHKVCQTLYRAFSTQAAADAYIKANPKTFDKDAKSLTLDQMVKLAAAG